jgi:hypothetical protein
MNSHAHAQLIKTRQADWLLMAKRAKTARDARAVQAHRRGTEPGRHEGAFAARRASLLAWVRIA